MGNRLCFEPLVAGRNSHKLAAGAVDTHHNAFDNVLALTDGWHQKLVDGHALRGVLRYRCPVCVRCPRPLRRLHHLAHLTRLANLLTGLATSREEEETSLKLQLHLLNACV